jgi:hypothetical protein
VTPSLRTALSVRDLSGEADLALDLSGDLDRSLLTLGRDRSLSGDLDRSRLTLGRDRSLCRDGDRSLRALERSLRAGTSVRDLSGDLDRSLRGSIRSLGRDRSLCRERGLDLDRFLERDLDRSLRALERDLDRSPRARGLDLDRFPGLDLDHLRSCGSCWPPNLELWLELGRSLGSFGPLFSSAWLNNATFLLYFAFFASAASASASLSRCCSTLFRLSSSQRMSLSFSFIDF